MGLTRGFTHIYTGNGKGKTTAAMGLAVRALGAGLKVCFIQFMKAGDYSEHKILRKLRGLTLQRFGSGHWVGNRPAAKDIEEARQGLAAVRSALRSDRFDLVVADEICVAAKAGLLSEQEVLDLIRERPAKKELVLTGRGAGPRLKRAGDLVTEMREVRHYYRKGVPGRTGIEL